MKTSFPHLPFSVVSCLALMVMAGCSSTSLKPAPVEDRSPVLLTVPAKPVAPAVVLPGAENAGKPGYYTVQKGDTLTRIGLEHGQSRRDLARWNNLTNPDLIEIGQVLRVVPPGAVVEPSGVVVSPVAEPREAASSALPARPAAPTAAGPAGSVQTPAPIPSAHSGNSVRAVDDFSLAWPANGPVLRGFDEVSNKGIDIAGKAGDAVLAAADGQVVYAGAALRGYGNLVILKHNNTYLTAYAHNQKLLVKEDQKVIRGEKIAEMGSSDADRVKLHFEVRKQGKPVDPARFLSSR